MDDDNKNQDDLYKEQLSWKARELALRIRVLKSQLNVAKQIKDATSDQNKSTRDIISSSDNDRPDELRCKESQELIDRQDKFNQLISKVNQAKSQIFTRSKSMIRELWDIYPINEFPDRKGYSICDIYLPKSENLDGHDETMVSVAIGHVGHLLLLLGEILDITLRFPLKYYGSKSFIYCNRKDQLLPLFLESFKSRDWIKFSYGMSLLNLNIVQIRTLYGLPTNDPEETLANLHGLKLMLASDDND